jgi:biotin carboxyl carrier protein
VKPDPVKPDPVKPDPAKPERAKPRAVAARIEAPAAGQITALLRGPRAVKKGETLFEIVRVTGDPDKIKELTAKVAEATKLAAEDSMYEPFLAQAKQALASERKVSTTFVKAPRAGRADPRVRQGASVHTGQLLAEIQ